MRWLLVSVVAVAIVATGELTRADGVARDVDPTNSSIVQEGFVPIGGIDQWISIRGENRANPVIVILHGGPAEAQTPLEVLYAAWEKDFTVVQWDQRGAGKTFGRNGKSTPDMTLDRMVQDGIEVAEYARQRVGKNKVILLGHSWGAFLGVNMIKKRPDLFYAFVGTGQIVNWAQTMAAHYSYTMKRAEAEGNNDALKELREIGPPPYEIGSKSFGTAQKWLSHYLADSDTKYLQKQMEIVRSAPGFSPQDFQDWIAGGQFSIPLLLPTLVAIDLPRTQGYKMAVPFFIIQGQEDHITPIELAEQYFRRIHAPKKRMVLIKGAGHSAYATNREEFLAALVTYVRPIAVSG